MERLTRFFSKSMSVIFTLTIIADLQHILRLLDSAVGNLRNVDQTVDARA